MELAIIWHSRTGAARTMAEAAADAAQASDTQVTARLLRASRALPDDLLKAQAFLFCCPENLAAISGEMKEFFDRCYYPLLGRIEGQAYGCMVAAGSDGTNAVRQIERIATGWRLRRAAGPLIICTHAQDEASIMAQKSLSGPDIAQCRDFGALIAHGLDIGLF